MKKIFFPFIFIFALIISSVESKVFIGEDISLDKTPEEEIFFIGNEIKVSSPVKGEFFGIGRNIELLTNIEGDIISIGYNTTFMGDAEKDMYVLGNNITLKGNFYGGLAVMGRNVKIEGECKGNIRVSAENIEIEGNVKGKTYIWGKDIKISGVFNDISLYGNSFYFNPGTVIKGDLIYSTPEKLDLSTLTIYGTTEWKKPVNEQMKEKIPMRAFKRFYGIFSLLIPVLFTLFFFPNLFKETVEISGRKFIPSFFAGLIMIIATLFFILVSFITIVGVPLGLIFTVFVSSFIYISRVFPAIFLGRKVLFKMSDKKLTWVLATFIGILLFTSISIHPTAKIIVNIICIPAGFGALFAGRLKLLKRLREEKIL